MLVCMRDIPLSEKITFLKCFLNKKPRVSQLFSDVLQPHAGEGGARRPLCRPQNRPRQIQAQIGRPRPPTRAASSDPGPDGAASPPY
jgi:hypothetical protein